MSPDQATTTIAPSATNTTTTTIASGTTTTGTGTTTTTAVVDREPTRDDGTGAAGYLGAGVVLVAAVAPARVQARRKTLKR